MKAVPILVTCLIVSSCALNPSNKTMIVLQNPQTKEMAQCKGDAWSTWDVYAATESCAKGYEKAGYVRLSEY